MGQLKKIEIVLFLNTWLYCFFCNFFLVIVLPVFSKYTFLVIRLDSDTGVSASASAETEVLIKSSPLAVKFEQPKTITVFTTQTLVS